MTDLYRQLENYRDSDFYPFHMPGHKRNRKAADGVLAEVYGVDITEIDGFDNLHQAQGILYGAQEKAACLYGSEKTYFLVNGSTCGILSAVAAAVKRGGRLLMARNCHKAVYHAAYLQELKTCYLQPETEKYHMSGEVKPEAVERALKQYTDVEAVLITSPTYEGIVSDIGEIADIVHRYQIPLIVDEAHGAHFGFHEAYPVSSVKLGADLVIHSVHKTLPAMTQTALLHANGSLVDRMRLERYLRIFQSSSPSYILMASIDSCIRFMEEDGGKRLGRLVQERSRLTDKAGRCRYVKVLTEKTEPCKLVISAIEGGMSGQELYDELREKYHLQMEMAADEYVLAILTLMDEPDGLDRLADALLEIDKKLREDEQKEQRIKGETGQAQKRLDIPEAVMTIAEAYDRDWEKVVPAEGVGRIAAEFVNLYPPGIPLIVPGERLERELAEWIDTARGLGLNVQGAEDGSIKVIRL